jgi:hypothetical protein
MEQLLRLIGLAAIANKLLRKMQIAGNSDKKFNKLKIWQYNKKNHFSATALSKPAAKQYNLRRPEIQIENHCNKCFNSNTFRLTPVASSSSSS